MNNKNLDDSNEGISKKLNDAFDQGISSLEKLQADFIDNTKTCGKEIENLKQTKIYWTEVAKLEKDDAEYVEIAEIAYTQLSGINGQIGSFASKQYTAALDFQDLAGTISIFSTTTTSASIIMAVPKLPEGIPYIPNLYDAPIESISDKLREISPHLPAVYEQFQEVRYTTQKDPIRSSFFQLRQTWDGILDVLASSENVKNSNYWESSPDKGKKPDRVTRKERLHYLAGTYISDQSKSTFITGTIDLVSNLYNKLNDIHNNEELDPETGWAIIDATDRLLNKWVTSIDKPIPKK